MANKWVFDNCTLPLQDGLATIAANDSILVINSSHNLSDGGFMVSALNHCLDDMSHENIKTNAPIYSGDAFKEDFQDAETNFDSKLIHPMSQLTSCEYDTNDPHLAQPGTPFIDFDNSIPIDKLSCYNNSTKKPQYLTEYQSIAIALSILALNKVNNNINFTYKEPLSLSTVLDMRRFSKNKSNLTWSNGNCVVKPPIKADVSKSDTIECVCKKLRSYLNLILPGAAFYAASHINEFVNSPPRSIFGCLSSIGPINFSKPIVDIDVQDCWKSKIGAGDHGENFGSQFTIVSYSKVSESRNEFCYFTRLMPASIALLNAKMLAESFGHVVTKVPLSAPFDAALNELVEFQKNIKKNF